jgi:hypothetical protein
MMIMKKTVGLASLFLLFGFAHAQGKNSILGTWILMEDSSYVIEFYPEAKHTISGRILKSTCGCDANKIVFRALKSSQKTSIYYGKELIRNGEYIKVIVCILNPNTIIVSTKRIFKRTTYFLRRVYL